MARGGLSVVLSALAFACRRWLLVTNLGLAIFIGLPLAAPVLEARGQPTAAAAIYYAYQLTCHQMPHRSFFLFGAQLTYTADELRARSGASEAWLEPAGGFHGRPDLGYAVAFCQRNTAIYGAMLVAGLAFALARRRLRPLPLPAMLALAAPMAVDGFTQLFGWRESTPLLRVVTGSLFGLGAVWFIFPYLELAMREIEDELRATLVRSAHFSALASCQERRP